MLKIVLPKLVSGGPETQASRDKNLEYAKKDLQRSGLTPDDIPIYAEGLPAVKSAFLQNIVDGARHYNIPYFYRNGNPIVDSSGFARMFRQRNEAGPQRYNQPSRDQIGDTATHPYFLPHRLGGGHKEGVYAIVEGEKKYAKLWKEARIFGVAIGGKDNWRLGGKLHPEIVEDIRSFGAPEIQIFADGDWRRADIYDSYSALIFNIRLFFPKLTIRLVDLSPFTLPGGVRLGIDDYLAGGGRLESLSLVDLDDSIRLSSDALIEHFGLEFDVVGKVSKRVIRSNHSNVMHLVEKHPMFGPDVLWWNMDTMSLMWKGAAVTDADYIHMTVLFERFFQMPKVPVNVVAQSIEAVCFKSRQRWPIRDWLKGLCWDGVGRIEKLFGEYVLSDMPAGYLREVGRRFMLGAVARRLLDYSKFDQMTILVGPQGIKKSTFWKALFGWENVAGIIGDQRDKDTRMVFAKSWCVNFEELDAYERRELSNLKEMITSEKDSFRFPYGKTVVEIVRRCVLVGNTNRDEFLRDSVSRREWPVRVTGIIDISRISNDRDQLWAEATARFLSGEAWWGEGVNGEWEDIKEDFREKSSLAPMVAEYLELLIKGKDVVEHKDKRWLHFSTVSGLIRKSETRPVRDNELQKAMRELGWTDSQVARKEGFLINGTLVGRTRLWSRK